MLHPWPQFSLLERNVWLNNESVTSWLSDRQRVIQILLILSPTRLGSKIGATRKFWVVSEGGSSSTLIYLVEVGFLYTSHQTTFRSSKEAHSKCRISAKEVHGQYIKSCASSREAHFFSAALIDLEKWHRTVKLSVQKAKSTEIHDNCTKSVNKPEKSVKKSGTLFNTSISWSVN